MKTQAQLKQFLADTSAKLNTMSPTPDIAQARAVLTVECRASGFNRAAIGVRIKNGQFEVK